MCIADPERKKRDELTGNFVLPLARFRQGQVEGVPQFGWKRRPDAALACRLHAIDRGIENLMSDLAKGCPVRRIEALSARIRRRVGGVRPG
jgi:hypothetical protein